MKMTRDSLEELRERLLGQHNVQQMIQVRAYEIYQMRGGQPGGEAHDWFRAESEVLAFLLADESPGNNQAEAISAEATPRQDAAAKTPLKKSKSRTAAKLTGVKASVAKKATAKRSTPKKPAESKPKSKRISKKPQAEGSDQ
jgi:hypothetical protein